jgi:hypothetical protein
MLQHAQRSFPDADIVPARGLYADSADWRTRWPREAPSYAALVFFSDPVGFIGLGTFTEIAHVGTLGKPVHFLDDRGHTHPYADVEMQIAGRNFLGLVDDPVRYAYCVCPVRGVDEDPTRQRIAVRTIGNFSLCVTANEIMRKRSNGTWFCNVCRVPAETEHQHDECSACDRSEYCEDDCRLSALACPSCGVRCERV